MKLPPHSSKLTVCFTVLLLSFQVLAQQDFTRNVDPFIGTAGHGHTFPGATVPFGMVQLSPDTRLTGWDGCSGYHYSDSIVYGFSHTHLSGTGISDYGDILLMPTVGELFLSAINADNPGDTTKGYASRFDHKNETAQPGYYSVKLDDENIKVELTTTKRAGLHRYTYPATTQANVILDLAHRDKVIDSYVRITGGKTFVGWRRSEAWARDQVVYFAAEFSQPFNDWGVALNGQRRPQMRELKGPNVQAYFTFDALGGNPLMVKVGISAVSLAGALKNLRAELDHWDFEKVKADATRAWNTELNKIQVTGGSRAELKNFYTGLYHAMIAPNLFMDVDGQYRGRDFKIHKAGGFDNYTVFSLWDTFRATHPLYTIIDQKRTLDFIKTFLAQYEQGGRLPVWELAANETDTMIGYHAVSVIADAAAKDIRGFDLETAFAAMKHSAELKHFGLESYASQGFINLEDERESVSRTLEYAYDDWCIAQMARMLGRTSDYQRYISRAQYYKNVFDAKSGFMRPRTNAGWLARFDPREVDFNFTEANSWQYTSFVPQDISGHIELMGGKKNFARKLDEMFDAESKTTGREQADITGLIGQYAHGNEPSHHVAYLYNYANQPWKTQFRVRQIMNRFYQPEPDGLIGNEDCGQMSAWYVLSAAGFYPVTPGAPVYAIGTPLFPELRFKLENGKTFVIKARGVSQKSLYIQAARLNGKPYRKSYLLHKDLMAGGELVFQMGARPNYGWGSTDAGVPVSRISDNQIVSVPVIQAAGKSFKDRLEIRMQSLSSPATIRYTTDASEPGPRSPLYTKPFLIDRHTTIKAIAIDGKGARSLVATARFLRIPHNWNIALISKYSSQYTGGGDLALIDGIRGTANWSGGGWQGYQGQDFVAVVDLGQIQNVSKLGAGFLQDVGSWIWMPRRVDFEVSVDGRDFHFAASIPGDVPEKQYGVVIKDFITKIQPQKARYVRIRAHSYGKIPSWHPSHNGDAWVFVDEIMIE
ncbi:MAG: GH92 family glycosyl hydrolase [Acidobacteriota bacterium]